MRSFMSQLSPLLYTLFLNGLPPQLMWLRCATGAVPVAFPFRFSLTFLFTLYFPHQLWPSLYSLTFQNRHLLWDSPKWNTGHLNRDGGSIDQRLIHAMFLVCVLLLKKRKPNCRWILRFESNSPIRGGLHNGCTYTVSSDKWVCAVHNAQHLTADPLYVFIDTVYFLPVAKSWFWFLEDQLCRHFFLLEYKIII